MLINYYSQYDFEDLSEQGKWDAYSRILQHAKILQEKLDTKSGVIGQKRNKIDYLKTAKVEMLRQRTIRNHAGSDARNVGVRERQSKLLSVYLEMKDEHDRLLDEAKARNWERPKRLTAKIVLAKYSARFPGDENSLRTSTVSRYMKEFKRGYSSHPEVYVMIND
jgi:hypothetical protein